MTNDPVLQVNDLHVRREDLKAVRGVNLTIHQGQRFGIVGESGAGKSLTVLAIMRLLQSGWSIDGEVLHDGINLATANERELASRRGRTISMIFQDPLSALNPTRRVGAQLTDVLMRHLPLKKKDAYERAIELFTQMRLPRPEQLVRAFPHELSGGQRQRVMIAMAVACYPRLIIADEPTTALDVSVQKQVLRTLDAAVKEQGSALLMITHDLPVIAAMCDEVAVMYGGRVVEQGPVSEVFSRPRHPYTQGLLESQPTLDNIRPGEEVRLPSIPGSVPPLREMPAGCSFRTRCAFANELCESVPLLEGTRSKVACWHPYDTDEEAAA